MPKSIKLFEQLMFVVVGLGLISFAAQFHRWESNLGQTILSLLIGFSIPIGITLLISRKRSNIARWVAIVLYALGVVMAAVGLVTVRDNITSMDLPGMIAFLQLIIQGYATYLLFMSDSQAWTENIPMPDEQDPEGPQLD